MRLFYGHFMLFVFGITGSPSTAMENPDGYIGCYEYENGTKFHTTTIQNNTGSACMKHCFPHYKYAGTELDNCYCGDRRIGTKKSEYNCLFRCGEFKQQSCGGPLRLTMYEDREIDELTTANDHMTSATSTTPTITTTSGIINDSISANATEQFPRSNIWIISIPIVIANVCVGFILVYRCKYKRNPTRTQVAQAMANNSYNGSDAIAVITDIPATDLGHRGEEAEASNYDTTSTYKAKSHPGAKCCNCHRNLSNANINESSYDGLNFDKSWKVQYCTRNVRTTCNCNNKDTYNRLYY